LLDGAEQNIVAIDLPHLPPKTVGPDETYARAGQTYRAWLDAGVLVRRDRPGVFVYRQSYTPANEPGRTLRRLGAIVNVGVQPFGPSPDGHGGVYPHEQTFSGPKADRLKLMRATRAQLSPIFGLYSDADQRVLGELVAITRGEPSVFGTTAGDGVLHELWDVDDPSASARLIDVLSDRDIFIADGHHRYTTALNYRDELADANGGLAGSHRANFCTFVLVALQDPAMRVLATHRVLGGMAGFDFDRFVEAARGRLRIEPFAGIDATQLADALAAAGPHAIGLYNPDRPEAPLAVAVTCDDDPLAADFPDRSRPWRQLDVAIVQHLIVEQICQPTFCADGAEVRWHFPHSIEQLRSLADGPDGQLGLILRPTPIEAIGQVSQAGELMPQKSTFFYPKLATGLVINPLE
jgi:uncharacterized protein (DUF1015 family)